MTNKSIVMFLVGVVVLSGCRPNTLPEETQLAPGQIPGKALYIPYPVSVIVDGDLDDWSGVPEFEVTTGQHYTSTPTDNGAFTFAVAANEGNLYLRMFAPDEGVIAREPVVSGDAFEFFLNFTGVLSLPSYQPWVMHGVVGAELLNQAQTPQPISGRNLPDGTEAAAFQTETGWGAEVRIPLFTIGAPAHGEVIGLQVYANGADSWGRSARLVWGSDDPAMSASTDPSVFGQGIYFAVGSETTPLPLAVGYSGNSPGTWGNIVTQAWQAYRQNYIFCGESCADSVGLVFDPSIDHIAVSEGIGYGLLLAVMLNDQHVFDIIYDASQTVAYDETNGLHHWRINQNGTVIDAASATDAEQDIAAALIFAQTMVDSGQWNQHPKHPYGESARDLLDSIYTVHVLDEQYLMPGTLPGFDWVNYANPSYFSPAWYRLYNEFEGNDRWTPLIDTGYELLEQSPGAANGLAPDWMSADGEAAHAHCRQFNITDSNCQFVMSYDAIRVPWRVAKDCLWYNDPRACAWSERGAAFQNSLPPDERARMYDLDGSLIVDYQDVTMVSMWLFAAEAGDMPFMAAELREQLRTFGDPDRNGYWGASDAEYYNQSLALMSATFITGDFRNLWLEYHSSPLTPQTQSNWRDCIPTRMC
ncbi:MAG: glycosyl hydrolase family 8 [Chloroflexota bacterium]